MKNEKEERRKQNEDYCPLMHAQGNASFAQLSQLSFIPILTIQMPPLGRVIVFCV